MVVVEVAVLVEVLEGTGTDEDVEFQPSDPGPA